MAGMWGLPEINPAWPFSTSTRMGQRTVHMPQTLNTDSLVIFVLPEDLLFSSGTMVPDILFFISGPDYSYIYASLYVVSDLF
jgi:hypothetical protein